MSELDWLAERFEENRTRLHAVAYRMLGSAGEAEDAVQEAWLRVTRAGAGDVENLAGWLTTITARVCLNMLEARRSRPEEPAGTHPPEPAGACQGGQDPEDQALLADSVGQALLVVLDALAPAERVAFVMHDMFAVPFEDIAPIVDRTPAAARKLASRARHRIQGTSPDAPAADGTRQRELVAAFLAASQRGDFVALLELLDPGVVYRADEAGVRMGGPGEVRGPAEVAAIFSGRAQAAQLASANGTPAIVWVAGGQPRAVFTFTIDRGKITAIGMTADPGQFRQLNVAILNPDDPDDENRDDL
jgi:RNA polymerase sigma factor (sigma-70 family)